jgi:adenylate kinase
MFLRQRGISSSGRYLLWSEATKYSRGLAAMRIVLLGPPGAGKGTQAKRLSNHFGIPHISTGDILRAAATSATPISAKLRDIMVRGELVPDELILEIIVDRIGYGDTEPGFILDGFPRNTTQARALDMLMMERGELISAAIELTVDETRLLARINGRMAEMKSVGEVVRLDDVSDSLGRRLAIYRAETAPLVNYYRSSGLLTAVDGTLPIERVTQQILDALSSAKR